MSNSEHIINVTENDFNQLVIESSHKQPVFVDFWADWCGPCKSLIPLLKKLAEEYQGKFILAMINSDEQQALASSNGVRSLPTVKVFKQGKEVDSFTGLQAEPVLRTIIEAHLDRESDILRNQGLAEITEGDTDKGLDLLLKAVAIDPDRENLKLDLAKAYIATNQADAAKNIIEELSFNLRNSDEAEKILAMSAFIGATENAASETEIEKHLKDNPQDLDARYQLGALKILDDNNEAGLMQFLEIMQRNRKYNEDAGYKAILAIFKLLGDDHDLVKQYRRKMAMLLH